MDLRRLRIGEILLGLTGGLLLASLFLPWYEAASGWEALTVVDLLLALAALFALAVPVITANQGAAAVPIAADALATLAGLVALLLVLFRVALVPGDLDGREIGLWLALLGAAGMVVAGTVAMRDERRPPAGRHNDATGVPIPAPREIETLPAPPAAGR